MKWPRFIPRHAEQSAILLAREGVEAVLEVDTLCSLMAHDAAITNIEIVVDSRSTCTMEVSIYVRQRKDN